MDNDYRVWADAPLRFDAQGLRTSAQLSRASLCSYPACRARKALYQTKQCRFIKPGTTEKSDFDHGDNSPDDGRSMTFSTIEEPGAWVALYNVETNPKYRAFLAR